MLQLPGINHFRGQASDLINSQALSLDECSSSKLVGVLLDTPFFSTV
jgi:hypothetical protein